METNMTNVHQVIMVWTVKKIAHLSASSETVQLSMVTV